MKKFGSYIAVAVVALVVGLLIGGASTAASFRTRLEAKQGSSAALQIRVNVAETLVEAEDRRSRRAAELVAELSYLFESATETAPPATPAKKVVHTLPLNFNGSEPYVYQVMKTKPHAVFKVSRAEPHEFMQLLNSF